MSARIRLTLAFTIFTSLAATAGADRITPAPTSAPATTTAPMPMQFAAPPPALATASSGSAVAGEPAARAVRLDRAAIRAKLAKNRAANLARFRVYQRKGVFPNNTYTDGKLNVWRDAFGNLCAAATIIQLSGNDALVQQTGEQNNFIRLADVTDGPLLDWILTSGLTQDEIVAIQEPMMGVRDRVPEPHDLEPAPILAVDGRLRRIEDRRLIRTYRHVDRQIVKHRNRSLDAATDRLLAHPDLAQQFLAG